MVTETDQQYLGIAITSDEGSYTFALPPGASRNLSVVYRPNQRELTARVVANTRVRPTLFLRHKVVHNKGYAVFFGSLPGPHADNVVVVIQVRDGKGWRAFQRYRTRDDGSYKVRYRMLRTFTATTYFVRAQVRRQSGFPYEEGNSKTIPLRVVP